VTMKIIFTAKQKHDAIKRELSYRQYVYPKRIARREMSQKLADYQIAVFEQILQDYIEAEKKERLL